MLPVQRIGDQSKQLAAFGGSSAARCRERLCNAAGHHGPHMGRGPDDAGQAYPQHVLEHLLTMAQLHAANSYAEVVRHRLGPNPGGAVPAKGCD